MITLKLTDAEAAGVWAYLRQRYPLGQDGNPLDFTDPQEATSPLARGTEKLYKAMRDAGLETP